VCADVSCSGASRSIDSCINDNMVFKCKSLCELCPPDLMVATYPRVAQFEITALDIESTDEASDTVSQSRGSLPSGPQRGARLCAA